MKYVLHSSPYMGDDASMHLIEADNHLEAKAEAFDIDKDDLDEGETLEDAVKWEEECNGDGQPYIKLFCVDTNEEVIS